MNTFINGTFKRLYVIVFTTIFLLSCSDGKDNENSSNKGLSIDTPSLIQWQENTELSYQISATGSGPLEFHLLNSEDASLFHLNKDSGVLSASEPFNFEEPLDSGADGVYELRINVVDKDGKALAQSLHIEITNTPEYEARIKFPIDLSNIGGHETSLNVRGSLTSDDPSSSEDGSLPSLKVKGVDAVFSSEYPGQWMAEIPVTEGENVISIELMDTAQLNTSGPITIYNNYMPSPQASTSDGSEYVYYLGKKRRSVFRKEISTGNFSLATTINDIGDETQCERFNELGFFGPVGKLYIECETKEENQRNLIRFNFATNQSDVILEDINFSLSDSFRVMESRYLIATINPQQYYFFDLQTLTGQPFSLVPPNLTSDFSDYFDVSEMLLYKTGKNEQSTTVSIYDLEPIITSTETNIVASNTSVVQPPSDHYSTNYYFSNDLLVIEGYIHFLGSSELEIFSSDGQFLGKQGINRRPLEENTSPNSYYGGKLVTKLETSFVLHNFKQLWLTTPTEGTALQLHEMQDNQLEGFLNYEPKTKTFSTYNFNSHRYIEFSKDLKVTKWTDYADLFDQEQYGYRFVNFQNNKTIHLVTIDSWQGDIPNDQPVLQILDLDNGSLSDYFSTNQFASFLSLNDPEALIRLENSQLSSIDNTIWFSAMVKYPGNRSLKGVYSYNLNDGNFGTIFQENYESVTYSINPSCLSSWYQELDGIITTSWGNGYLRIIRSNKEVTELIPNSSQFAVTDSPIYDSKSNRIYFTAKYWEQEDSTYDFDNTEYLYYNLNTHTIEKITDTRNSQFPTAINQLNFDKDTRNLYINDTHGLIVMDPHSGDQVYMSAKD